MAITAAEATRAVEAALAKSVELGTTVSISVVDAGGELAAFARQDGSAPVNFDISFGQAYTVTKFGGLRGGKIARLADYNWFRGASAMRGGCLLAAEGALPLRRGEELVGAIGVSGAPEADDLAIAEAGAVALE